MNRHRYQSYLEFLEEEAAKHERIWAKGYAEGFADGKLEGRADALLNESERNGRAIREATAQFNAATSKARQPR